LAIANDFLRHVKIIFDWARRTAAHFEYEAANSESTLASVWFVVFSEIDWTQCERLQSN
jgi:hypothetical protein